MYISEKNGVETISLALADDDWYAAELWEKKNHYFYTKCL